MSASYHLFANAFLAVGGFVVALFAIFGALCLLLRGYLAFEDFCAECFAEDAGANWSYGDHPAVPDELKAIPESVEPFHRSGRNTL